MVVVFSQKRSSLWNCETVYKYDKHNWDGDPMLSSEGAHCCTIVLVMRGET